MDDSKIKALAKAGGICHRCGGVHTPKMDQAIMADIANLPFCDCEECTICRPLTEAIVEVMTDDQPFGG